MQVFAAMPTGWASAPLVLQPEALLQRILHSPKAWSGPGSMACGWCGLVLPAMQELRSWLPAFVQLAHLPSDGRSEDSAAQDYLVRSQPAPACLSTMEAVARSASSHYSRRVFFTQESVLLGASGGRPWMGLGLQVTARQQYEVTIAAKRDPIQAKRRRIAGVLS